MSRKRLMRGIERITIFLTSVAVIIAVIAMPLIHKANVNNFVNNAEIVEISVGEGHGVKHYEDQFRPDFMSIDEYHELIEDLNNLPQSGEIYSGQVIKFYK
jgi:hypothetical protein